MTALAPDVEAARAAPLRTAGGLGFALVSAASFGLSGSLARGLMEAGWSAGAAVTVRVLVGAVVLAVPAALAMRGRWRQLVDNAGLVLAYGALAVAGCQLFYFNAVAHMEVGLALLIEYTAPVLIVGWLWLRHGQRPGWRTVAGAVVAVVGMVLVLDVVTGAASVSVVGTAWGFGAAVGAAVYFLISADEGNGLPPIVLAAAGLVVGAVVLLLAGAVGLLPMAAGTAPVHLGGTTTSWWVPLVALGVVTAALAYTSGIAATRRLGSRLASFVALGEVLMALLFAWALLGELPRTTQLAGGVLVLAGVVVVKLGERDTARA